MNNLVKTECILERDVVRCLKSKELIRYQTPKFPENPLAYKKEVWSLCMNNLVKTEYLW